MFLSQGLDCASRLPIGKATGSKSEKHTREGEAKIWTKVQQIPVLRFSGDPAHARGVAACHNRYFGYGTPASPGRATPANFREFVETIALKFIVPHRIRLQLVGDLLWIATPSI